jgi:adenine-specific DNA-methyltransferase
MAAGGLMARRASALRLGHERKRHGVHYTPHALAGFLADRTVAALGSPPGPIRILDPACGDGELLVALWKRLGRRRGADLEIVGYDLDPDAISHARLKFETAGVVARLEVADFIEFAGTISSSSFDVIITNPPYVRTQILGADVASFLAAKFGLKGRVDLMHPFVSLAPRILRKGGILGLLCSNRFLTTKAGANVRSLLVNQFRLYEVFDLGDTKLFEAAVLPAVVIGAAGLEQVAVTRHVKAYELPAPIESAEPKNLFEALMRETDSSAQIGSRTFAVSVGRLATGSSPTEPWRLTTRATDGWHARVRANTHYTFGDLAPIRVGIKTTADAVFIRDDWDILPHDIRPEGDLLLPLLTHHNADAWTPPTDPSTRVLYPYNLSASRRRVVDLSEYPRAAAYLRLHEDRLKSRKYVIEAGREWFEMWVPQRPSKWREPKIVFPDISDQPRFTIDRTGAIVNGDCYWINILNLPNEDIAYLLLGIANSSFSIRFYDDVCGNKLYASRRRWITQYVSRFPVPDPASPAAQQIISLSRKICGADEEARPELEAALNETVDSVFGPVPERQDLTLF